MVGLATLAKFRDIIDITFDLSGNLLICDYHNHRVRKIDQQGIVSTIAGTGSASYTGPGNPTLHNLHYPRWNCCRFIWKYFYSRPC